MNAPPLNLSDKEKAWSSLKEVDGAFSTTCPECGEVFPFDNVVQAWRGVVNHYTMRH